MEGSHNRLLVYCVVDKRLCSGRLSACGCCAVAAVSVQMNIDVAIVTAAGYPGDASKFEGRLQGLLQAFKRHKLPAAITNR